MHVTANNAAYA